MMTGGGYNVRLPFILKSYHIYGRITLVKSVAKYRLGRIHNKMSRYVRTIKKLIKCLRFYWVRHPWPVNRKNEKSFPSFHISFIISFLRLSEYFSSCIILCPVAVCVCVCVCVYKMYIYYIYNQRRDSSIWSP